MRPLNPCCCGTTTEELVALTRSVRWVPGLAARARIVLLAAEGAERGDRPAGGVSRPTVNAADSVCRARAAWASRGETVRPEAVDRSASDRGGDVEAAAGKPGRSRIGRRDCSPTGWAPATSPSPRPGSGTG